MEVVCCVQGPSGLKEFKTTFENKSEKNGDHVIMCLLFTN
jgi:hypothetical protein